MAARPDSPSRTRSCLCPLQSSCSHIHVLNYVLRITQVTEVICQWELIPMGIRAIPIPIQVVSHSFPFPIMSSIPIPMGFPWDSHSHWESHSHGHLYYGRTYGDDLKIRSSSALWISSYTNGTDRQTDIHTHRNTSHKQTNDDDDDDNDELGVDRRAVETRIIKASTRL